MTREQETAQFLQVFRQSDAQLKNYICGMITMSSLAWTYGKQKKQESAQAGQA